MTRPFLPLSLLIPVIAVIAGCGVSVHYVVPPDWHTVRERDSTIAHYSEALQGKSIFIDPGHGGDDRRNMGPEGEVVEADINLRVARTLRDYLARAGVQVMLSRDTDVSVSLKARAEQANAHKADLFVSIHHNAAGNTTTNYTSTWYHSLPGRSDYQPSSHDVARYIQRDLAFVMGNPGSLATFDGTMSDELLYPGKGFAVLREATMPAVLVECAFLTSAYEEQRLKIEEFNEIEAWGIFRGIGKYFQAGTPVLTYRSPRTFNENRPTLEIHAEDPSGIELESIRVYIDEKEEGYAYDARSGIIKATPARELAPGYHDVMVRVRNRNNNHSFPFRVDFAVGTPPAALKLETTPREIPPDPRAFCVVSVRVVDSTDHPVESPLPVHVQTNTGIDTVRIAEKGSLTLTIAAPSAGMISVTARHGPLETSGIVQVQPGVPYTRGIIMTSDGKQAGGAEILFPGGDRIAALPSGDYVLGGMKFHGIETMIAKPGFFSRRETFSGELIQDPIMLSPVARGTLHGRLIVLDLLHFSDSSYRASKDRPDVRVAERLMDLIQASGARCLVLEDVAASAAEQRAFLQRHGNAAIIRLGIDDRRSIVSVFTGDSEQSRRLARTVKKSLPVYSSLTLRGSIRRSAPRDEAAKMTQMSLLVPLPGSRSYDRWKIPLIASNVAWGIYHGLLMSDGYNLSGTKKIDVTVIDRSTKEPARLVDVILNGILVSTTDEKGKCSFHGISASDDDVQVRDPAKHEIISVKTETIP